MFLFPPTSQISDLLDAVHSGKAIYLGTSSQGHLIYRFNGWN